MFPEGKSLNGDFTFVALRLGAPGIENSIAIGSNNTITLLDSEKKAIQTQLVGGVESLDRVIWGPVFFGGLFSGIEWDLTPSGEYAGAVDISVSLLDNVPIEVVPEPSAHLLISTCLLSVGAIARRRSRLSPAGRANASAG